MKKLKSLCFLFLSLAFVIFINLHVLSAQNPGQDDMDRLSLEKTGVDVILEKSKAEEAKPIGEIVNHISGGIKYIPGKVHTGTCEDDDIYTFYSYIQDKKGRVARKTGYNVGPNNTSIESPEYLKYYVRYEYDNKGNLSRDFSYNGKGPDGAWFTSDDIENYHSIYEYDPHGRKTRVVRYTKDGAIYDYTSFEVNSRNWVVKDVVYKGKGPDDKWFTADDEIEKYHRFEYSKRGHLQRMMEYLAKANGRGPDGVWFSGDDVISSAKVFLYDEEGFLKQIRKYVGAGPDNKWFTADDVLQYYTVYDSNK